MSKSALKHFGSHGKCQVPAIPHTKTEVLERLFFPPKGTEMFKSKHLALAADLVPFGRCFYPKQFTVL